MDRKDPEKRIRTILKGEKWQNLWTTTVPLICEMNQTNTFKKTVVVFLALNYDLFINTVIIYIATNYSHV